MEGTHQVSHIPGPSTSNTSIQIQINSEWFKDLNVRWDTVKLLEDNIGRTLTQITAISFLILPLE